MTPTQPDNPAACQHTRVRLLSRDEETEYVECDLCGDIFESEELRDITIEAEAVDGADGGAEAEG